MDITLIIPENPDYASTDHSMLEEEPSNLKLIKVPIKEPSRILKKFLGSKTKKLQKGFIEPRPSMINKILLYIRGNYFIPDARISWVDAVLEKIEQHSISENVDYVITTGPPHSVHLIGLHLKKKEQLFDGKWIADFRDPWTTIGYHKSLRLSSRASL